MKKLLLLSIILLGSSLKVLSQTDYYIDNCKMYMMSGPIRQFCYFAQIPFLYSVFQFETDKLYILGENMTEYQASLGSYLEFQYQHAVTGGFAIDKQIIFPIFGHTGLYAFTQIEKRLCLVNIEDDSELMVLEDNFQRESNFSISVLEKSQMYGNRYEPTIYVINGEKVRVFAGVSQYVSSTRLTTAPQSDSQKMYTIGGVEVTNPDKGIYIQEGKKVIR